MLLINSIKFGSLNKIRVKSNMSRNEKRGHGGKHTRPKKWSGARRPAGPATTALNIFIRFGSKLYRQIVGIPMGTNCAPLVADLFLFCYERHYVVSVRQ